MNEHIEELKRAALKAAMELREATGAAAFVLPVPGSNPQLYLALGSAERIRKNLDAATSNLL